MRRSEYRDLLAALVLVGIGVFAIAVGVVTLRAGKGARVSVSPEGQQEIAAFSIPFGVAFLILALLTLTTALRRHLQLRQLSRRYGRPDPARPDPARPDPNSTPGPQPPSE